MRVELRKAMKRKLTYRKEAKLDCLAEIVKRLFRCRSIVIAKETHKELGTNKKRAKNGEDGRY